MYINVITPQKETKSQIRCQSLLKLRNAYDHVVIHFASNFRVYSYRMTLVKLVKLVKSVSWVTWSVNQSLPERGICRYVSRCRAVYYEDRCILIFCTTILILSVFAVISKRIEEYIYDVNECQTHIHDAQIHLHIQPVHSWTSTDTRNN